MKILSIDTSTQVGSVAVLDDENVRAELSYQTKSSHAEVLMGVIEEALKKAILIGRVAQDFSPAGSIGRSKDLRYKAGLDDIDGIAVAIGPGSFTGLRIGLATAKGLAMATGKPIVGVSTLKALCHSEQSEESRALIVPCINAYRGEVYAAVFSLSPWGRGEGEGAVAMPECSITPGALCDFLSRGGTLPPPNSGGHPPLQRRRAGGDPPLLFIGDGAVHYKDLFRERLGERFKLAKGDKFPIAVGVGLLALPKFKEGNVADINTLAPNYIRKSDAELKKRI